MSLIYTFVTLPSSTSNSTKEVIFIEHKDERKAAIRKAVAILLVMMFVAVAIVAVASPVAADAASDIENLTATTSAMLMALIPLIITIGIFTLILGLVVFRKMGTK